MLTVDIVKVKENAGEGGKTAFPYKRYVFHLAFVLERGITELKKSENNVK